MKQYLYLVLVLILVFGTTGCARTEASQTLPASTEKTELIVFAAASMTESLEKIAKLYAAKAANVKLTFNFDSSGTLKTQIQEGAECDLFISAGQKQMDELDILASTDINTEGLDFVLKNSRINLLENKVALVIPEGNPKNITGFEDLMSKLQAGEVLMAMGNSDVPVGQYTQKILQYFDIDENAVALTGAITYGTNVKEVTTQVVEASVDCGIVYCTDAFSAGLKPVDYATTDMCGKVIYPAAVMERSKQKEAASAFLQYLTSDEAMMVFESVGFSKV